MITDTKYLRLNNIIELIAEFGITDDSYREIKIRKSSKKEIEKLISVYEDYGDEIWEYLLEEKIITNPNDFYFELSAFARACDSARYISEEL